MSRPDELLRPFAAMGGDWTMPAFHDLEADIVVWGPSAGKYVTAGDVRAARRHLDGAPPSEPDYRPVIEGSLEAAHERILGMCDHTSYFDDCAGCVLRAALAPGDHQ